MLLLLDDFNFFAEELTDLLECHFFDLFSFVDESTKFEFKGSKSTIAWFYGGV